MRLETRLSLFLGGVGFWCTLGLLGTWKVYYPDCQKYSRDMDYFTARDYAIIFKAILVWEW